MELFAEWSPVTEDFGLIDAPVDLVTAAYLDWLGGLDQRFQVSSRPDFASALAALPPLSAEKRRRIFVPTRAGWTGFFQSGIQGSDPFPTMSHLTGLLGVDSMRVCVTPRDATHPACIWEVYAPTSRGGAPPLLYRRSISAAAEDGSWAFDHSGDPFPFEELDAYSARRKRDRFTTELLTRYLAHLGLHPFEPDFFVPVDSGACVLVERIDRPSIHSREFTLDEARAGVPGRTTPG